MYKLLALDLDGTLLTNDLRISEENKQAIHKAAARGVHIVIATARPYRLALPIARDLGLDNTIIISMGGGDIRRYPSGEVIRQLALTPRQLKKCAELFIRKEWYFHYMDFNADFYFLHHCAISSVYTKLWGYSGKPRDLQNWTGNDIGKICVAIPDKALFQNAFHTAQTVLGNDVNVVLPWPDMIFEVFATQADKAYALQVVSPLLGIESDEMVAIGDEMVDSSMIEYAGLGVAMGNARQEVKDIADITTLDNESHGVAEIIKKHLL